MLQPMTKLLLKARKYKYAIPQPDFVNLGMAALYLEAAAQHRSPIILGFGEDYVGASEAVDLRHLVQMCEVMVSRYDVPVVLHLDHGSSYEACAKAINAGFSSVMIDGSSLSFDDNVRLTKEVVKLAKISGVSVEGEIGRLKTGDGYELAKGDKQVLTDPAAASEFVKKTGIDALAVSIGTVHGEYSGKPDINIDLLRRINKIVGIPLVLHGASGIDYNTLKTCVREGITKVKKQHEQVDYVQIPDTLRDIRHITVDMLSTFIKVLGSVNKA